MNMDSLPDNRIIYIDEAGDAVLWNRRGKLRVGSEGCSNYFMIGAVEIADQLALGNELENLRKELLADPYFKDVPSMQPNAGRTAVVFHAKDDPPEVRREVFKVLLKHDFEFHVVVRHKLEIVRIVTDYKRNIDPNYRYKYRHLYDNMAKRLMKDKLHTGLGTCVIFSRRGASDRTEALRKALENARAKWCVEKGIDHDMPPLDISAAYSWEYIGLQAVDYCLWALQRCYERGEDRFITNIWPKVGNVWDCDQHGLEDKGVHYTKEKPLSAADVLGI